jgi:hypothetical protein
VRSWSLPRTGISPNALWRPTTKTILVFPYRFFAFMISVFFGQYYFSAALVHHQDNVSTSAPNSPKREVSG